MLKGAQEQNYLNKIDDFRVILVYIKYIHSRMDISTFTLVSSRQHPRICLTAIRNLLLSSEKIKAFQLLLLSNRKLVKNLISGDEIVVIGSIWAADTTAQGIIAIQYPDVAITTAKRPLNFGR